MATPSSGNTAFGRGSILFDRIVSGARTGFIHLGNCKQFSTSVSTESVDMIDYTQNTSAPYNTALKSTDIELKISGFEFATQVLSNVFMGDVSSITQSAATVTTETIAAASLTGLKGKFFQVAKRNISAPIMLQGATTLVSGTDYEIYNSYAGVFRILPTGSTVVDGTALKATYVHAALTAGSTALETIRAFNQANVYGQILFLPNNSTGPNWEVQAWYVNLKPDGDIPLISDDWNEWNMVGKVLSDAAGAYGGSTNEPYARLTLRS